jgi:hypothetical protein
VRCHKFKRHSAVVAPLGDVGCPARDVHTITQGTRKHKAQKAGLQLGCSETLVWRLSPVQTPWLGQDPSPMLPAGFRRAAQHADFPVLHNRCSDCAQAVAHRPLRACLLFACVYGVDSECCTQNMFEFVQHLQGTRALSQLTFWLCEKDHGRIVGRSMTECRMFGELVSAMLGAG